MVSDCGNKISVLKQILLGIWGRNMLIMSEKKTLTRIVKKTLNFVPQLKETHGQTTIYGLTKDRSRHIF